MSMSQNTELRVIRNAFALFWGRAFVMAFSFFFIIYAARLLKADDFGKYALVRGYFELFLSLSSAGLSNIITREIAKKRSMAGHYLSSSVVLVSGLALVAGSIMLTVVYIFPYATVTRTAALLACIALVPAAISVVFQAGFLAFERAKFISYGVVVENLLRTNFSILALYMGHGLKALFVVLILARVVMLLFYAMLWNRRIASFTWAFDWSFLKQLVRDWRVFTLESWLSDTFANFDIIALSAFHGERAVGLYSAASRIVGLGTIVASSYASASFPYMSQLFERSREKFRRISESSIKYMMAIVLPAVVALSILSDRFILLLYGREYEASIAIFRVLIWILMLKFLNPYLSFLLFAQGRQNKSLQVIAASLAFYVLITPLLVSRWGGIGMAWALLLSTFLAFCLYIVFALEHDVLKRTIAAFGRIALATAGVGALVMALRDIPLVLIPGLAILAYIPLSLIFRVSSPDELRQLRRMASRQHRDGEAGSKAAHAGTGPPEGPLSLAGLGDIPLAADAGPAQGEAER